MAAMRVVAWVVLGFLGVGCGEDRYTLFVDVVTTHPPLVQFDRVVTTLAAPDGTAVETAERPAAAGEPYATGVRVAEISDVAEGSYRVEVALWLGDALVAERGTLVTVTSDIGVTVSLSADCDDESCNGLDDDCDGMIDEGEPATLCALSGVEAAACVAGSCEIGACAIGMLDCDAEVANGCEVDGASDDASCGACGVACATGDQCDRALCRAGGSYVAHAVVEGLAPEAVVADGERGWVVWEGARGASFFGSVAEDLRVAGFDGSLDERFRLVIPGTLAGGPSGDLGGVAFGGVAVDPRGNVHVFVVAGQSGGGSYAFPGGTQALPDGEVVGLLLEYSADGVYARHRVAPGDLGRAPPTAAFELATRLVGALPDGALVVAGDTSTRLDLGDGDSIPARAALIVALGPSNEIVWKRVVVASEVVTLDSALVGPSGQTLATFWTPAATVDFGGGETTVTDRLRTVVLYDPDGAFVWQNRYRGEVRAVSFGPDGGFVVVVKPEGEDALAFEMRGADGELAHSFSRDFGRFAPSSGDSMPVAVGPHGDVYLTGTLGAAVDFGGGARSALLDAMALAAYARDGGYRYDRYWSDPGTSQGRAIAMDDDRVLLAGTIAGELDLGGGVRASGDGDGLLLLLED